MTENAERKKLEARMEKVEENNQQILQIVTEIKLGLCGSKQLGVEGVIDKVKKNSEYIERDKRQKYKFAGAAGVIIFALTFLKDWIIGLFTE